jgi:hypothetical protein
MVIAGPVPAIPTNKASASIIEMAGASLGEPGHDDLD